MNGSMFSRIFLMLPPAVVNILVTPILACYHIHVKIYFLGMLIDKRRE